MPNLQKTKTSMPLISMDKRRSTFDEVAVGYSAEDARNEAARCLNCKHKPCVKGCPVQVRIPEFIRAIAAGDEIKAAEIIRDTNTLPAICGRVCPQETQCEKFCVRAANGDPVGIGRLERYAADTAMKRASDTSSNDSLDNPASDPGKGNIKVAIIGSGPAGLSGAGTLAKLGYGVTIFEALHEPGGVLSYGIPEFRLPKALVRREIEQLEASGVTLETNVAVGRSLTLDDLYDEGFSAALAATGAGLPSFLKIPGESLGGVYTANEFLTRINLMKAFKFPEYDTPVRVGSDVVVVGGGNVAMDAARSALRIGANVTLVYRRGRGEMPARAEEIEHALEEGVAFNLLTNPTEILPDDMGNVRAVRCDRMELGEPDASGRRRPVEIPGSAFDIPCQTVVIAIGNAPNPLFTASVPGLKTDRRGCVIADPDTGATSVDGVYAAGDAVSGAATVILAMGTGRDAALAIHERLTNKRTS